MQPGRILLIVTMAMALGACNKSSKKKVEQAGVQTVPTGVTVTLVKPGKGPLKPLRYAFKAGLVHAVELDLHLTVGVTTEVRSVPVQQLPMLRMKLTVEHRSVSPEGELQYAWRLDGVSLVKKGNQTALTSRYATSLEPALMRLRGLKGSGTISSRGVGGKTQVDLPASVPQAAQKVVASLRQQLQQLSTPFPDKPVGVGGVWEVTRSLRMQTIRAGQTSRYELVKRQGDVIGLKVTVKQFAPQQKLGAGRLPAGAVVQLKSYQGSGKGQLRIDLRRAVPSGEVATRSTLKQVVSAKGKTKPMELTLGVRATFREPAGAKAP